jgi:hypothetical protein
MQKPIHGYLLIGTDQPLYLRDILDLSSDNLLELYNASKRLLDRAKSFERLIVTGGTGDHLSEGEFELIMPLIQRNQFELNCTRAGETPEIALVRRILTHLLIKTDEIEYPEADKKATDACEHLKLQLA